MAGVLKKPKIAIICPVVNCINYTKQFVASIKTKYPAKLIIINNNSTDNTAYYLERMQRKKKLLYINNKENKGVAKSWNDGIKLAKTVFNSQYYVICNNDIILHPEAIDNMLETLNRKEVLLVSAKDQSGSLEFGAKILKEPVPNKEIITEDPEFSCFTISDKTVEKVGYFDEKFYPAYFEDNDYHYRIKLINERAIKTNRALYYHYKSRTIKDNDFTRKKSNLGYIANRDYYVKKWGGKPGQEKNIKLYNKKA